MQGVDKADQMLKPVDPSRKSMAWFKKMCLHLLMRLLLNSFLVHVNIVDKNVPSNDLYYKLLNN